MDLLYTYIEYVLHLDKYLASFIQWSGIYSYLILALIIFCETGLVIMPFLPGDSLLFVIGALSASGALNVWLITILLISAGIIGDTVNYHVGKWFGPRLFNKENVKFLNKNHLEKAHDFYERHGGKAVIIARFIPIVRTFVPFVAGMAQMSYGKFLMYNVVGAFVWVLLFIFAGYFFGNIPLVKQNFTFVIFAIIVISIMPGVITFIKNKTKRNTIVN